MKPLADVLLDVCKHRLIEVSMIVCWMIFAVSWLEFYTLDSHVTKSVEAAGDVIDLPKTLQSDKR